MPKFKVETDNSLYEPLEVEIDGETFPVINLDREAMRKLQEFDTQLYAGDADAAYRRLEFLIGKTGKIDKLTVQQVVGITDFIVKETQKPQKKEKNSPRPEGEKSPS